MADKVDLVAKGGRVIDPAQGLDGVMNLAIADGRIAGLGADLPAAAETIDVAADLEARLAGAARPADPGRLRLDPLILEAFRAWLARLLGRARRRRSPPSRRRGRIGARRPPSSACPARLPRNRTP